MRRDRATDISEFHTGWCTILQRITNSLPRPCEELNRDTCYDTRSGIVRCIMESSIREIEKKVLTDYKEQIGSMWRGVMFWRLYPGLSRECGMRGLWGGINSQKGVHLHWEKTITNIPKERGESPVKTVNSRSPHARKVVITSERWRYVAYGEQMKYTLTKSIIMMTHTKTLAK